MTVDAPEQSTVDATPDPEPTPDPPAATDAPSPAPVTVRPETVALATLDAMLNKKKRVDDFIVNLEVEGQDEPVPTRFHLEGIDGPKYDALQAKCPPSREQAGRGFAFDPEEFEPLLVSEVCTGPKLEKADWKRIRKAENWSGGEWASLYQRCVAISMMGLDVPFNSGD